MALSTLLTAVKMFYFWNLGLKDYISLDKNVNFGTDYIFLFFNLFINFPNNFWLLDFTMLWRYRKCLECLDHTCQKQSYTATTRNSFHKYKEKCHQWFFGVDWSAKAPLPQTELQGPCEYSEVLHSTPLK